MWIHWCVIMLNWYPNTRPITRFSANAVRNNYHFAFHTFSSPEISTPAFSSPDVWCREFHSRVFHSREFSVPYGWCPPKFKWFTWPNHAPLRMLCHPWASICYVNLPTKFEVSISIHYEDMKGDIKCRNVVVWVVHSRSLEIAPIDRAHTSSY